MGLVTVRDEWTKLVGHRFLNSQICLWIGLLQALVCIWGLAQHCHSFIHYHKILRCDFLEGSLPLEAADAIIFDIGLFHSLWGIRGCVAEYLDGGFGRLAWCVTHIISLTVSLPFAFVSRPRPCFLWPLLIQQSAYGVGLLILLIAALPRILPQLMEPQAVPVVPISVYICGTMLNFFLLYVYWHWYWHVASLWGSAVKVRLGQVVRNANNRSRRDKPRIPKEDMSFLQPLDVEKLQNSTAIPNGSVVKSVKSQRRGTLIREDTNVSQIFEEVEAEVKMNGKLANGSAKKTVTLPPTEPPKPKGLLDVPATSKTVRARYPQEPPVKRAMAKREKEETVTKREKEETIAERTNAKPNVATRRALFKQKGRSTREVSTELEPLQTQTKRRLSTSPMSGPEETSVAASSVKEEPKRIKPNGVLPNKRRSERRRSTVTINSEPLIIPPPSNSEDGTTPSPPPPPIYATRLTENAYENRMLRAQDEKRNSLKHLPQERTPRRRLPKTPSETPAGEIPRPKFYIA